MKTICQLEKNKRMWYYKKTRGHDWNCFMFLIVININNAISKNYNHYMQYLYHIQISGL